MLFGQGQWTSREVSVGGVSGRGGKGWNTCLLLERIGRDQSCPERLGSRLLAARRRLVRERDQSSSELVDDRSLNSWLRPQTFRAGAERGSFCGSLRRPHKSERCAGW